MRLFHAAVISLIALAAPHATNAQTKAKPADPIVGVDKAKHFFIAGFVETMTFAGLEAAGASRSPAKSGAIAMTLAVSIGREIHDKRTKGLFSVRDLAWDLIGGTAAMLVINKTR